MKKKQNAGISMVEIIIALAIFMILMLPIVKGIVSALDMSSSSKELQYRNEFAEGIMEHVKSVDLKYLLDEKYYNSIGTEAGSFSSSSDTGVHYAEGKDADSANIDEIFDYANYSINGKVKLGTKHKEYNYKVEVSNEYYADKKSKDPTVIDPNNMKVGIIEDIDRNKVVLIDDVVLNYDSVAENALKAKKLQGLKDANPIRYRQQIEGGDDVFVRDKGYRMINIKISDEKEGSQTNYKVECELIYYDPSSYLTDHFVEYIPYGQVFKGELPNIYIMYNPCYYNSNYVQDDYIGVDISGLSTNNDEENCPDINVFLVELASNYSTAVVSSGVFDKGDSVAEILDARQNASNKEIYNKYTSNSTSRDRTKIHLMGVNTVGAGGLVATSYMKNIHVYHNLIDYDLLASEAKADNPLADTSKSALYKDSNKKSDAANISASVDTIANKFLNNMTGTMLGSGIPNGCIGPLSSAQESNRGLYKVKVYLKPVEDGDIDTDEDIPILTGTKGGNES